MRRDTAIVAFLDILFILIIMLMPLISRPTAEQAKKIPLSIEVSWTDETDVDIDTHMLLPDGRFLWYRAKDLGGVHVDKDDLGSRAEAINRELVLLDDPPDGTYYVSLFNYRDFYKSPIRCIVLLSDRKGVKIREQALDCPVHGEETPVMKFEIRGGKVIRHGPSDLRIIQLRRESGG